MELTKKNKSILKIQELSVEFTLESKFLKKDKIANTILAVDNISFDIESGKTFCLVGESGSGKSVCALAITRLLAANSKVQGKILFNDLDLINLNNEQMRNIRGSEISMIFQEPMTSLNPILTIGEQIIETILEHNPHKNFAEAIDEAIFILNQVQIKDSDKKLNTYPHQLSGGQRQRVMIAMALVCGPKLLIADEPTTALDVTIQAEILDLMKKLQNENHMSILFITHDFGVVAQVADHVGVMQNGKIVEIDNVNQVLTKPTHTYSKKLINSLPENLPKNISVTSYPGDLDNEFTKNLIEINNLQVWFPIKHGLFKRTTGYVRAVDDVNLNVEKGKVVALVGESGCGKTTLGKSLVALEPIKAGKVLIDGIELKKILNEGHKNFRSKIQMVFQDPKSSLNPRHRIIDTLIEPLRVHKIGINERERIDLTAEMLSQVHLPKDSLWRFPHAFSGGQRQRISIARALLLNPQVLICDEITSALDVSVQAEILYLLQEIQNKHNLSIIFITHNIGVVKYLSDSIAVMKDGKIVEFGETNEVCSNPTNEYTKTLLASVPQMH